MLHFLNCAPRGLPFIHICNHPCSSHPRCAEGKSAEGKWQVKVVVYKKLQYLTGQLAPFTHSEDVQKRALAWPIRDGSLIIVKTPSG